MLKAKYKTKEEIPEGFESLYEERGGEWLLTKIEGIKTDADVQRVQRALDSEKTAHKATKDKLQVFTDMAENPEELQSKIDRIAELEAAAGGTVNEEKLNQMVEARIKSRLAPIERAKTKAETDLAEANKTIETLQGNEKRGRIEMEVRKAAEGANVAKTAIDDVVLIAGSIFDVGEDGRVTAKESGLAPDLWLTDMKAKRPHWWPASQGGGAGGSGGGGKGSGANPWTKAHWNLTEQGRIVREKGMEAAERMAKEAGTTVKAGKPAEAA